MVIIVVNSLFLLLVILFCSLYSKYNIDKNKVTTTVVIRLLDDPI